jgi:hypothetical protein
MNMTARDRLLLTLLPGLAIFMIYVAYFFTSRQRPLAKLQADVEAAHDKMPTPAKVHERKHALNYAQKQYDETVAAGKKIRSGIDALAMPCQSGECRSQRITRLTELLKAKGLQVLAQAPVEAAVRDGKSMKLSPAQERLVKQLTAEGKPAPQAWQFEIVGRFADLTDSLRSLADGELIAIPLAVTMDEVKDASPHHHWSLLVWI